jgi:hypothetical protein
MGTSKSFPTPSGGQWTPLKNDVTNYLGGDERVTPAQIVGGTVRALDGLGSPSPGIRTSPTGGPGGGSSGGGRTSVVRAVSRLGGFGGAFQRGGLDDALGSLGLEELKGRPAAEVISVIAEHLAEGADGLQSDILSDALKDALVEAAALEEGGEYKDLEAALQSYLDKNGVEGLVELFLTNFVFDRVWMAVENHAQLKAEGSAVEALGIAVGQACRSHVESLIREVKGEGRFEKIDWFGQVGIQLGNELISELEGRLRVL